MKKIKDKKIISSKRLLPAVAWAAIADDDFVFRKGKYCLRVEQMDKRVWWWCLYIGKEQVASSWDNEESNAKTEKEAKLLAELCFVRAWQNNSR
jgi:hypothetical protein